LLDESVYINKIQHKETPVDQIPSIFNIQQLNPDLDDQNKDKSKVDKQEFNSDDEFNSLFCK
jgi:hypothetical protein